MAFIEDIHLNFCLFIYSIMIILYMTMRPCSRCGTLRMVTVEMRSENPFNMSQGPLLVLTASVQEFSFINMNGFSC